MASRTDFAVEKWLSGPQTGCRQHPSCNQSTSCLLHGQRRSILRCSETELPGLWLCTAAWTVFFADFDRAFGLIGALLDAAGDEDCVVGYEGFASLWLDVAPFVFSGRNPYLFKPGHDPLALRFGGMLRGQGTSGFEDRTVRV